MQLKEMRNAIVPTLAGSFQLQQNPKESRALICSQLEPAPVRHLGRGQAWERSLP